MSSANWEGKSREVAEAAERILDAYGMHETSDSPRVIYTSGDLNIAKESGVLEIIFRGSLVLRRADGADAGDEVFEEHGVWVEEVERIAGSLPESSAGTAE